MKKIKIYIDSKEPQEEFIIDENQHHGMGHIGYTFFVKDPEGLKSKQVIVHPASVTAMEIEET